MFTNRVIGRMATFGSMAVTDKESDENMAAVEIGAPIEIEQ